MPEGIRAGGLYYEATISRESTVQLIAEVDQLLKTIDARMKQGERIGPALKQAFAEAGQGAQRAAKETSPLADTIKRVQNETSGLRASFQAGFTTQEQFKASMARLVAETGRLTKGLDTGSSEFAKLARAGRTAQAGLEAVALPPRKLALVLGPSSRLVSSEHQSS